MHYTAIASYIGLLQIWPLLKGQIEAKVETARNAYNAGRHHIAFFFRPLMMVTRQ